MRFAEYGHKSGSAILHFFLTFLFACIAFLIVFIFSFFLFSLSYHGFLIHVFDLTKISGLGASLTGKVLDFQFLGLGFNSLGQVRLCWMAVLSFISLPWSLPVLISPIGAEIQDVKP